MSRIKDCELAKFEMEIGFEKARLGCSLVFGV